MLKKIYKHIKKIATETSELMGYLLRMLFFENFKNYFNTIEDKNICISKKLVILGNGPSLLEVLKQWKTNGIFKDADILTVNYFCHDPSFVEIKPKFYVLSDPEFFFGEEYIFHDKVDNMYKVLNKEVFWPMFLFIPYYAWKKISWKKKFANNNIMPVPLHSKVLYSNKQVRNWFFKHGLGNGNYATVVLHGEYIGLQFGYKEIYLYGVDHNFFDNLCIDENNRLCSIKTHFYDSKPVIKPIVNYFSGKEYMYSVHEYLTEVAIIFKGHEIMRDYADYCSAKIYNCTSNSLIDAYERFK